MPRHEPEDKQKPDAGEATSGTAESPHASLPAPGSVIAEEAFTSPEGGHYRILHTTERDAYDDVAPSPAEPGRPPKRPRRAGD